MKAKHSFEPHLVMKQAVLGAGTEWLPQSSGWSCLLVSAGVAYWLNPRTHQELGSGWVLICSEHAAGLIRASQVGGATIQFFRIHPERLIGVAALAEQQFLENVAAHGPLSARIFSPEHSVSAKFHAACQLPAGTSGAAGSSLLRLRLVDVFFTAFGEELLNQKAAVTSPADAKARLKQLLSETPASDLLDLSFQDLVEEMRCTPRHLSRIFHEVVGMSFREKQAQVRLIRAQELLATTESKVLDVALESGYQSLSLFNLMFKKRFGLTPGEWRTQQRARPDRLPPKPRTPQLRLAAFSGGL
ncbi:MAG: helix-turn-helix domain-containing protein [Limisphaerales bacterium]